MQKEKPGQEQIIPFRMYLWKWIKEIDTEQKIKVYYDKFFVEGLTPMECDTRERNMLVKAMGDSDWYVQIDSDEYFADFELFLIKVQNFITTEPTTVNCRVVTLFKELTSGFLAIDESFETLSFATNNPVYTIARNNTSGNKQVNWDDLVYHQSWAREPAAIKFKLKNWSHKNDFKTESFFKLWDAIDEFNCFCLRDFHPLHPVTWPKLKWIPGNLFETLNSLEIKELRGEVMTQKKKKNLLSRLWREIKEV
jgi:glycosyltransferase involved in cell wall biosynthesis